MFASHPAGLAAWGAPEIAPALPIRTDPHEGLVDSDGHPRGGPATEEHRWISMTAGGMRDCSAVRLLFSRVRLPVECVIPFTLNETHVETVKVAMPITDQC